MWWLLRPRYERLCAQGHVVTSANGVCPYCGDRPAEDRTPHYLFLGAAIAFLLFVVLALAVDLPQQIIDWVVGARDWLGQFIDNLPALIELGEPPRAGRAPQPSGRGQRRREQPHPKRPGTP